MRFAATVAVAVVLVAGLVFWGGVVAPGYWSSIALGVGWFVVVGLVTGKVAKQRPDLRLAVRAPFLVLAVAVSVGFYWTSVRDTEVNERTLMGEPASKVIAPAEVDGLLAPQE